MKAPKPAHEGGTAIYRSVPDGKGGTALVIDVNASEALRRETCLTLATYVVAEAANDPAVMHYVAVNATYRLELLAAEGVCVSCGAVAALAQLSEEVEKIVAARNRPASKALRFWDDPGLHMVSWAASLISRGRKKPPAAGKFRPWGWLAWVAWIMAWATITGGLMVLSDGYGW